MTCLTYVHIIIQITICMSANAFLNISDLLLIFGENKALDEIQFVILCDSDLLTVIQNIAEGDERNWTLVWVWRAGCRLVRS